MHHVSKHQFYASMDGLKPVLRHRSLPPWGCKSRNGPGPHQHLGAGCGSAGLGNYTHLARPPGTLRHPDWTWPFWSHRSRCSASNVATGINDFAQVVGAYTNSTTQYSNGLLWTHKQHCLCDTVGSGSQPGERSEG